MWVYLANKSGFQLVCLQDLLFVFPFPDLKSHSYHRSTRAGTKPTVLFILPLVPGIKKGAQLAAIEQMNGSYLWYEILCTETKQINRNLYEQRKFDYKLSNSLIQHYLITSHHECCLYCHLKQHLWSSPVNGLPKSFLNLINEGCPYYYLCPVYHHPKDYQVSQTFTLFTVLDFK